MFIITQVSSRSFSAAVNVSMSVESQIREMKRLSLLWQETGLKAYIRIIGYKHREDEGRHQSMSWPHTTQVKFRLCDPIPFQMTSIAEFRIYFEFAHEALAFKLKFCNA